MISSHMVRYTSTIDTVVEHNYYYCLIVFVFDKLTSVNNLSIKVVGYCWNFLIDSNLLTSFKMNMERWIEKVAIVTGASSGIGYSIAEKLVDAGVTVIAVARRKEKLDELKINVSNRKGKIHTYSADVTNEQSIVDLFKWVKINVGPVHILINNAGVTRKTNLCSGSTQLWRDIFETNVIGLCIATREAIQDMRANNVNGHIIHINSVSGHKVVFFPNVSVYPASKYAVTALTETLRNELNINKEKIKISSISPGYVKTDIIKVGCEASGKVFSKEMEDSFQDMASLNAEDVASAVIFVLSTPSHVQIHELIIKAIGEEF